MSLNLGGFNYVACDPVFKEMGGLTLVFNVG
jgi:hypothetical protein